ncbi:PREDICTED: putative alpha-1-antitrypsin-related protein [Chinchilla lanigera]|uniref:putative alpha-1-antitrypsin-related protein n=1 Tax=Chinchilla lanigera TaxID=34839 RepID=UPI00038F0752|nr:PREDICTED: putative alpha-1-antitrypsin-related protein [Chinchilla lanigera]
MSSCISRGLLILAGLCSLVPGSQAEDPEEMDASVHDHELHQYLFCHNIFYNVVDFAFNLYRESASWSKTSNVLLSPMSIMAAFAMLSRGTRGGTHIQILEGLKFNLRETPEAHVHQCFQLLLHIFQHPDHQLQLTMGSSLFVRDSLMLLEQFVQDVKELYNSDVISISFRDTRFASKQINYYVEKETHGEIVDLINDLEEDTDFILVNYISLHEKWTSRLQAEYIVEEDFYVDEETAVTVPMIIRLGIFLLTRDEELSSWVLIQHSVGDAIAFFILPDTGKMQELEEGLTQEHFNNILETMDERKDTRWIPAEHEKCWEFPSCSLTPARSARIHFPRLSMSATYDLRSILRTLGITKVFSQEADFSGVTEVAPVSLSTAVHKAVLIIDERGAETVRTSHSDDRAWSEAPTIKFNRPFFLFIREENTNIPLFVGKVLNPMQQ